MNEKEITRTIIAGDRTFRVIIEQRMDLALLLPKWEYRLVEYIGVGIRSYRSTEPRIHLNILWGDIMSLIGQIVGDTPEPLDTD